MKILWFHWKDREHPLAGGAETVNEELAKRLAKDGHEVIFIVPNFPSGEPEVRKDGYRILRVGGKYSVYWHAYQMYKKQFVGWPDLVIDGYTTIPFFAKFYVRERNILFVHNLCRKIWFYEMFFPASLIGYLLEPLYLPLIADRKVITVSDSTRKDLLRFGFKSEKIQIISEGIEIDPIPSLDVIKKFDKPTILALGSIRPMKRTDHIVKAFELAKKRIPDLELVVAGKPEGRYGSKVLRMLRHSPYADSIHYLGPVSREKKIELMQKSHIICVTSIKEGWGLVVTEANSQGTPAVVYDVDGLRDSVHNNVTGLICDINTPQDLAGKMTQILQDKLKYAAIEKSAQEWSKEITFDNSYKQFIADVLI